MPSGGRRAVAGGMWVNGKLRVNSWKGVELTLCNSYVHGIMDGEAIVEAMRNGVVPWDTFRVE